MSFMEMNEITQKDYEKFFKKNKEVNIAIKAYNLADRVYSPYYFKGGGMKGKIQDIFGQLILSN
ncbi:hypothetical protein, partial [[Eubacterium] cellulosolvens]